MIDGLRLILRTLFKLLQFAVLIRVLFSWMPGMNNGFVSFINMVTEPILSPVRNILSKFSFFNNTVMDFSPFFAMLMLMLLESLL